jgi:phage-related protein
MTQETAAGSAPVPRVVFYRTLTGHEPVREWLRERDPADRRAIGEDIKTAQYGWPLGMPLIRKLEPGLWEVRSHIGDGTARVLFSVSGGVMVLLHGLVKKSRKIDAGDLAIVRRRLANLTEG